MGLLSLQEQSRRWRGYKEENLKGVEKSIEVNSGEEA